MPSALMHALSSQPVQRKEIIHWNSDRKVLLLQIIFFKALKGTMLTVPHSSLWELKKVIF